MSFSNLKKMSRQQNIESMLKVAESGTRQKNYQDTRFWKPTVDKAKNGYAVIRFLPAPDGETMPWVKYNSYGFRGPTGQWYIENSLTSVGKNDPVAELNSQMWSTGSEEKRNLVRKRAQRTSFVSNILVISDPGAPENEGKLFLYRYGKRINQKIISAMKPEFEDESPMDPFSFWEGANFRLKIRQIGDFPNYDKSHFDSPSALYDGNDAQLETLYNSLYPLQPFVDPNNGDMYKSYQKLHERLQKVLHGGSDAPMSSTHVSENAGPKPIYMNGNGQEKTDSASIPSFSVVEKDGPPATDTVAVSQPVVEKPAPVPPVAVAESMEDTLNYFEKLANE